MAVPACIIITMVIMILVRFTACFCIYLFVIITVLALGWLTYHFISLGFTVSPTAIISAIFFDKLPAHIAYKVIGAICLILTLVISVTMCCFHKRINIAISMIKASARFVNYHWYLFTISLFKFALTIIFLFLCLFKAWGVLKFT